MAINVPNDPRPLGPATQVNGFAIRLRPGSLRCGCGHVFRQNEAQPHGDDGARFVCNKCGLDHLETIPL
jgi:hypothetical protein